MKDLREKMNWNKPQTEACVKANLNRMGKVGQSETLRHIMGHFEVVLEQLILEREKEVREAERERILGELRYCYDKIERPEADRIVYANKSISNKEEE